MITYEPLWNTMKKKNITTYTLIYKCGISSHTVHNMKQNEGITLHTLNKLCNILDCTPNDILKFTKDSEPTINSDST